MLIEKSNVYSFGILIMEIISRRNPVGYAQPPVEVNLVEWLKTMVANHKSDEVVDPKFVGMPPSKAFTLGLLWLLTAACNKTGMPQIARWAIELVESHFLKGGRPEYNDGRNWKIHRQASNEVPDIVSCRISGCKDDVRRSITLMLFN